MTIHVPSDATLDAEYRIFTTDLLSGAIKEELPLTNISFTQTLNAAGSFSGEIGIYEPKATVNNIGVNDTAIYVERNGVLVWGGIVITTQVNLAQGILKVGAEGFWSYFKRRYVIENRSYPGWDLLDIVKDLVMYAQGHGSTAAGFEGASSPGPATGHIGVELEQPLGSQQSGIIPSTIGSGDPTQNEANFPSTSLKNIGDTIEQLSKEDSVDPNHVRGFDFGIFPDYDHFGKIHKIFKVGSPFMGTKLDTRLDLGAIMLDLDFTQDGKKQANSVLAIGSGYGGTTATVPPTTDSHQLQLHKIPLLEQSVHFKDVASLDALQALANGSLVALANPVPTIKAVVRPSLDLTLFVPHFGDFFLGDSLEVFANEGYLQLDDVYRISEWSITLADTGQEDVSLTLTKTATINFS